MINGDLYQKEREGREHWTRSYGKDALAENALGCS